MRVLVEWSGLGGLRMTLLGWARPMLLPVWAGGRREGRGGEQGAEGEGFRGWGGELMMLHWRRASRLRVGRGVQGWVG